MSQNFLRIYKRTFVMQHVRNIPRPNVIICIQFKRFQSRDKTRINYPHQKLKFRKIWSASTNQVAGHVAPFKPLQLPRAKVRTKTE